MDTVIFTIGRTVVGTEPMDDNTWAWFQSELKSLIRHFGGEIVATNLGTTVSPEWGIEEGFWVSTNFEDVANQAFFGDHDLDYYLALLAQCYRQDAIGIIGGKFRLVEAS